MNHTADCKWIKTTEKECDYRDTFEYCPHAEHACDCQGAVTNNYQQKVEEEYKEYKNSCLIEGGYFSPDDAFEFMLEKMAEHQKETERTLIEKIRKEVEAMKIDVGNKHYKDYASQKDELREIHYIHNKCCDTLLLKLNEYGK